MTRQELQQQFTNKTNHEYTNGNQTLAFWYLTEEEARKHNEEAEKDRSGYRWQPKNSSPTGQRG